VENNIIIDLTINGNNTKNYEILQLTNYIIKNKLKNVTLILDRAYSSYDFINFLFNNDINFIIRFKNNCKNFNFKINNFDNLRIIKYEQKIEKEVINKNINSEKISYKSVILEYTNEYTLITNLNKDEYNDEKIKELYKKRWSVEIFFKLLKKNFKFETLIEYNKEQNDISYKKLYICNLIIIYLSNIVENIANLNKDSNFLKK
jgi:putative transposase